MISITNGFGVISASDCPVTDCNSPLESKVLIPTVYGPNNEFTGTLSQTRAIYELPQEVILEDAEIIIFEGCE